VEELFPADGESASFLRETLRLMTEGESRRALPCAEDSRRPVSHTTPLHAAHERAGAAFTDFAGYDMPLRYASDLVEHHGVRNTAGMFDLSHMAEISVRGLEAPAFLDYALSNRLSALDIDKQSIPCCSQKTVESLMTSSCIAWAKRNTDVANAATAAPRWRLSPPARAGLS